MPFIRTDDQTNLFYTDWGDGKPVVFVHAWALNGDMWNYQMPDLLDAGLRCIAYDRRGHGRSDRPGGGYEYDTLADDLAVVIEALDLSEITLVGHSQGGGDVLRYLSRHGEDRIESVVLLAPTTPLLARTEDNADGVDPGLLAASAEALRRDVAQWCSDNAPGYFGATPVSPGLTDWTIRQILDTPLKVLLDTAAAVASTDFRAELPALRVPTLVIHGDLDASAPIDLTGRRTAALIPDSRLIVYRGSGHGLYAADHERVNSDLLAFIRLERAAARQPTPSDRYDWHTAGGGVSRPR